MARFDRMFSETEEMKKAAPHPKRDTKWIHYTKLVDHQAQYCNEKSSLEIESLADLIDADKCVIQNLLVRKADTDEYEIIAGHKRRRACKMLVEERGKKEYEFLPCTIEVLTDIRAEFQLYSSNRFHDKDDYEKMHELERMKYLLETYPEEFPHLQTGRMVERLAKQMNLKRSTVGEYLAIARNLGKKGKEEFQAGGLKKSAAVELAALPEEEQEELLGKGMTSHKEIKAYKVEKREEKEENPETEEQIAGQYKVVNTDMDIGEDVPEVGIVDSAEEDVPKFGTQIEVRKQGILKDLEEVLEESEYTVKHFNIEEQKETSQVVNFQEEEVQQETTVEEVAESDVQKEQYTPQFFFSEQKEKLEEMLRNKKNGSFVPDKLLERQRFIVCAMEFYISQQRLPEAGEI